MYLTYEEYIAYGGTLDEATFNDYEWEAEAIINWYTFDRLVHEEILPEAVKRCANKLIQLAKLKADALTLGSQTTQVVDEQGNVTTIVSEPTIQSQSNDGVSISYNTVSASEAFRVLTAKTAGNIMEDTVKQYLQGVKNSLGRKVLYRGVYADE